MKGDGKKDKKKTKSSKAVEVDQTKHDTINEKSYVTREIETSITLLESPENGVVLESLLFLSKYADIQKNNLNYVQSCGLVPKLLKLLDHNICILRVSLRLLSRLLTTGAAQIEINEEKFNEPVLTICKFYASHEDVHVKEFSVLILSAYSLMGQVQFLLNEPNLISTILKTIAKPENEVIFYSSLSLFSKIIETKSARDILPAEENFHLEIFIAKMFETPQCFKTILEIFEKLTYFGDDKLQILVKECKLLEHLFTVIVDPEKKEYTMTCLNIVMHCMRNENTNSYFVQSLEFLKFCQWVKTCSDEAMLMCIYIFLELSQIDSIRQMLFDLSVEDSILSFLRSNNKKILNTTCTTISFMSKHKYCCEKMITPVVIKKILQMLMSTENNEDPYNETALTTLHYLARREPKTLHMVRAYSEPSILLKYLKFGTDKLSEICYRRLFEIVNMFVTNYQLQSYILSPDLYDVILAQTLSRFDEICMRSLEIMINCLNSQDFVNYFLLNKGSQIITKKLSSTYNENIIRFITIFVHNALMIDSLTNDLIHNKVLLTLKTLPDGIKYRNPLIQRVINSIYNMCLPLKFFEIGRLELTDKLKEKFYIIAGPWTQPFPFLEILQLRRVSTMSTIYVIDVPLVPGLMCNQCYDIQEQHRNSSTGSNPSVTSIPSEVLRNEIKYGKLSHDPYLPKYIQKVQQLLTGVSSIKDKVKILAQFIDSSLCGPKENCTIPDKLHSFKLHIECIKEKLGTNMIPIGYLRLGFHCERALLFKALADQVYIPATLVKGKNKLYWNEITLIQSKGKRTVLAMFVVDLMNNIGQLLPVGSRDCNAYCDIQ